MFGIVSWFEIIRDVLEGILWVLKTGARWRDLPDNLPSASTCRRRLRDWEEYGVWDALWREFMRTLDEQQTLDWEECFIDGSFAPAKKGGSALERRNAAREQSGWWWRTARVFLWEAPLESASPAEVRLASEAIVIASERMGRWPGRLIADKACDADWLRHILQMVGGELICPHRRGRKRQPIQDGRKLRRYRKRWKVERLFAWLGNWRCLLIRHERLMDVYSGFFKIACVRTLVRHF